SLEQDKFLRGRDSKIRNDLIQKILLSPDLGGKKMKANGRSGNRFESCNAFDSYTYEGEEK
ncbi:MAG: hypothetical protein HN653_02765, partial [Candidatus Marinimicrobia bacterium]|nr:hypothetical protein [Candidatus Neomarinimicrobiota bacterium]